MSEGSRVPGALRYRAGAVAHFFQRLSHLRPLAVRKRGVLIVFALVFLSGCLEIGSENGDFARALEAAKWDLVHHNFTDTLVIELTPPTPVQVEVRPAALQAAPSPTFLPGDPDVYAVLRATAIREATTVTVSLVHNNGYASRGFVLEPALVEPHGEPHVTRNGTEWLLYNGGAGAARVENWTRFPSSGSWGADVRFVYADGSRGPVLLGRTAATMVIPGSYSEGQLIVRFTNGQEIRHVPEGG